VQWLFALPVAALLIQGGLAYFDLGEPYPALVMPGFAGTRTDEEGVISTTRIAIEVRFVDGLHVERPTVAAFFGRMPSSILAVVAANVLRHSRVEKGTARNGMKYRVRATFMPSRARRAERRANGNQPTPAIIEWTRARVSALYPDRVANAVVVNWLSERYAVRDRSLEYIEQVPLDSFEVPLQ
jgi:hypothetical protein